MTHDDEDFLRAVRDAVPSEPAPASLHQWARETARAYGTSAAAGENEMRAGSSSEAARQPLMRAPAWRRVPFIASLAAAALLGAITMNVVRDRALASERSRVLVAQIVDNHLQSLMAEHLLDVKSSDQHTVKPWFAGRVPFAPKVVSLDSAGFPLLGGRLAYVAGRVSSVSVYGRRKHVISVYAWPASDGAAPERATEAGYNLESWTDGGITYCAVTDASSADLDQLRTLLEKQ